MSHYFSQIYRQIPHRKLPLADAGRAGAHYPHERISRLVVSISTMAPPNRSMETISLVLVLAIRFTLPISPCRCPDFSLTVSERAMG